MSLARELQKTNGLWWTFAPELMLRATSRFMQMTRFPFCFLLLLLASHQGQTVSECGPGLFTHDFGSIVSHRLFGRQLVPLGLKCEWRILAPPNHRILLFATKFSLEWSPECGFDALEVFDGLNRTAPRIGHPLCGGYDPMTHYIVSSGQAMSLRLSTDGSVTKVGFSLRYRFLDAKSPFSPGLANRSGVCDPRKEMRCRTLARSDAVSRAVAPKCLSNHDFES